MQVVDLADEFALTTAEALEICAAAGIEGAEAGSNLGPSETERWRNLATARKEWQERNELAAVGAAGSSFGPLPEAPWEQRADGTPHPTAPVAPAMHPRDPGPLGTGWGTEDTGGAVSVSPYAPAALALAVVSLIFPFIPGFGAFALAWYAKDRIERSQGRLTGERLATAAQVVAAIGIAFWALLLAVSIYGDIRDDAAARDDGQVETGTLGWDEIAVGSCVRIPRADLTVREWTALDCLQPHEAEVYAVERVAPTNREDGRAYPGRSSLIPGATRFCQERFAGYVGTPYEQSTLRMAVFFPSGSNWNLEDDRTIGCIVFREDYLLVDGTLAQSAR